MVLETRYQDFPSTDDTRGMSHLPVISVSTSGNVNKMGSKNATPDMQARGTTSTKALGIWAAGLCTSSAILATVGRFCDYGEIRGQ
jgi:hypothetical protein